jgi:uncharacterized protein
LKEYIESVHAILLFGLIGSVLIWIAKSMGFFNLPKPGVRAQLPVFFRNVVTVFGIYLGMTVAVAPLLAHALQTLYDIEQHQTITNLTLALLQLGVLAAIFLLLYLYTKAQDPHLFQQIWKDRTINQPQNILADYGIGMLTWIIGFPLVVVVGQLADMSLYFFFGFESFEQSAVRYLKTTLDSPKMLSLALFTILIAAPVIEEFLFRGYLQTFLKRHMPIKLAIVISSLCFSLFHITASQGLGNFSLVASLFTFALFLGFIYERQGSLFASVGLHMTFNTVSTLKILFFPD